MVGVNTLRGAAAHAGPMLGQCWAYFDGDQSGDWWPSNERWFPWVLHIAIFNLLAPPCHGVKFVLLFSQHRELLKSAINELCTCSMQMDLKPYKGIHDMKEWGNIETGGLLVNSINTSQVASGHEIQGYYCSVAFVIHYSRLCIV